MPDNKLSQVTDRHIRSTLDELRSDVDVAFSALQRNPGSQSCCRQAAWAAIEYLYVVRECTGHLIWNRNCPQCTSDMIFRDEAELNSKTPMQGIHIEKPWDVSICETFRSAAEARNLNVLDFSPPSTIADALFRVFRMRQRLLDPRTPSSLRITKIELQSALIGVAWAHATAHRLLAPLHESPSQKLIRSLRQREIPPYSQRNRPH
ncbi:hypothetical protein P3T40_002946 [Paraburkholderia sp. EB58]|jgi:hypothetical protein|uniref:hypothetical protein n=1 Tax=Paraburkholderia sp. EB58 TaxID=3035125 RepID=UPI003D21E1F6